MGSFSLGDISGYSYVVLLVAAADLALPINSGLTEIVIASQRPFKLTTYYDSSRIEAPK